MVKYIDVIWNYDDDGTDDDPNIVFSSVCCLLSSPLFFPIKDMLVDHSQSTQYDDDEKDLFVDLGHRVHDDNDDDDDDNDDDNDGKDLFVDLGHRVPDVLLEVSIVVIPTLFVEMMYKQHKYHLDITLLLFCFFVQIALGFLQKKI